MVKADIYIVTKYVYWDEYTAHVSGWEIFKNRADAEIFIQNDQSAECYKITKATAELDKL